MDFKITTESKEEINCVLIQPSDADYRGMGGARGVKATGDFGKILFYEVECPDFSIWYRNYKMAQTTCLYGWVDAPLLELHFTIKNNIHFQLAGFRRTTIREGHFNMTYIPCVENKIWFERQEEYATFDVYFSRSYLDDLSPYYPVLDGFLKNADKGFPATISPFPATMSHEMIHLVGNVLQSVYEGDLKRFYLQSKMAELLLLALDRVNEVHFYDIDIVLRPTDIEKIRAARNHLLFNMDNPCTLVELAHRVGLNDFKLKKGFRQLYNMTIFDFLLNARMERAHSLLLETDMPVQDIALLTGYKNISNFTSAFKRIMGYSPSSLIRGNRKKRM